MDDYGNGLSFWNLIVGFLVLVGFINVMKPVSAAYERWELRRLCRKNGTPLPNWRK
jgi:hypothetical protein